MNESLWRKAEANQLMRETRDRIKRGIIKTTSLPNILVRDGEGGWKLPPIQEVCKTCLWPAGACVGHNDNCPY